MFSFWNKCHRNIGKTPKIRPQAYTFKGPLWWAYKRGA